MTRSSRAGILVFCWTLLLAGCTKQQDASPEILKVQLAYPIYSLDPRVFDDWSSVFVANHIFPRLLPVEGKSWISSVARDLKIQCISPDHPSPPTSCKTNRVSFQIASVQGCTGQLFSVSQIRDEFFAILKAKSWLFPGWQSCPSGTDGVCIEFPNHADVRRRLENLYFRFGWSRAKLTDSAIGAGAYCLTSIQHEKSAIVGGRIAPNSQLTLPTMDFTVSQDPGADFHLALQGSTKLLRGSRRNVQPHTPLPYYVVSNPALAGRNLPWNTENTAHIIRSHLLNTGMIFDAPRSLLDLAPCGRVLEPTRQPAKGSGSSLISRGTLLLPNYLPGCPDLASGLNEAWRDGKLSGFRTECGNLVNFVENSLRGAHPAKSKTWGAFLISLSPGAPERRAISDQYFSTLSAESLTGRAARPEDSYYQVGMGQSLVTVDGQVLCGVAATSLGLGDLTAADFIHCNAGLR